MKKDDLPYLNHILDAISLLEKYSEGVTYEDLLADHLLQDGFTRQLEIIGEATKNLSDGIKEKYPDIEWREVAGMRDRLIHCYFGVNLNEVWDTVKEDIPGLKKKIIGMRDKLRSDRG